MSSQKGRRHVPEGEVIMPNGDVTYITEPTPVDCTCKGRAATVQIPLRPDGEMSAREYHLVKKQMNTTIVTHSKNLGGIYSSFNIVKLFKLKNCCLWKRYKNCQLELIKEIGDNFKVVEHMFFHGSAKLNDIVNKGFDERYSYQGGYFGAGIYFASNSSKSNQYALGTLGVRGVGCALHGDNSCYKCERQLLLCRVLMGRIDRRVKPEKMAHAPPGCHSVEAVPAPGYLQYPEYVVYRGEQAYPEYLVIYTLVQ